MRSAVIAVFAEHEPDEAGMRAERMMEKLHSGDSAVFYTGLGQEPARRSRAIMGRKTEQVAIAAEPGSGDSAPAIRLPLPGAAMFDLFKALILGIVEGLTEFIPVSSTGHLLLLEHFFGFDDDAFGKTFVVLIQLGAILAILSIYFGRLWRILLSLPHDAAMRGASSSACSSPSSPRR